MRKRTSWAKIGGCCGIFSALAGLLSVFLSSLGSPLVFAVIVGCTWGLISAAILWLMLNRKWQSASKPLPAGSLTVSSAGPIYLFLIMFIIAAAISYAFIAGFDEKEKELRELQEQLQKSPAQAAPNESNSGPGSIQGVINEGPFYPQEVGPY